MSLHQAFTCKIALFVLSIYFLYELKYHTSLLISVPLARMIASDFVV